MPGGTNPQPSNFHAVFGISSNAPNYPGRAMQIDVAGDTLIGETPTSDLSKPNLGDNPTHTAIFPNNSRVFVASAGSVLPGGSDVVSWFYSSRSNPPVASGLGDGEHDQFAGGVAAGLLRDDPERFMYVANFGTNSVSQSIRRRM